MGEKLIILMAPCISFSSQADVELQKERVF